MSNNNGVTIERIAPSEFKRSTQEIRRRAVELELIAEVSNAATQLLDESALLQTVVDLAKDKFALYHAHVYLVDPTGEYLVLAAGAGEIGAKMVEEGHRIAIARQQSLVARAARTQAGVTINDVTQEPGFLPNKYLPATHAEIALPMTVGSELIGVLDFQSDEAGRFDEEDVRIKTILAQQIAIAMRNVRTLQQQQRQLQFQEASAQIRDYLRDSQREIGEQAEDILRIIGAVFHADYSVVAREDDQQETWQLVTGIGAAVSDAAAQAILNSDLYRRAAIEANQNRRLVIVARADESQNILLDDSDPTSGIKSFMAMPLYAADQLLGIVFLSYIRKHHDFLPDEIHNARLMQDQVSAGLARRLQEEQIRAEQARAQALARNLETVSEVSSAITTILNLDELLLSVVELTKSRFDLYHAHIYLLDDSRETLTLAAGAGTPGSIMKERGHRIPISHPTSIVGRVAREKSPWFVNDVTTSPTFLPNPLLPKTRSEAAAPILAGGRLIGVLDVQSEVVGRFTEVDAHTMNTLASQIAVAVVNANAFQQVIDAQTDLVRSLEARSAIEEQLRRRASDLETVATVSTASSTMLDQDELLSTVVDLTKANFELYHVHVYLLDDLGEYLVLAAGAGEPGQIMRERGHKIPAAHPNSLVARAARTATGVVANDVGQQPDFLPNPMLPETRSEMAIPMIAGDVVIGVLDVQSKDINRFSDDDVLIQTTLAAQIAVALQNARAVDRLRLTERAIENSTSGMSIADASLPDMPLVYVNHAFEVITGYSASEVLGKNCRFLQGTEQDQSELAELRAALQEQRQTTVVLRNYRKDGTLFWNELRLAPIFNVRGELTHYVGVQTDITERREIEIEREHMLRLTEEQAQKDRETADRLREVDRLKSQFIANMSHELRTPLNSIIGYSELLLDGDDGELSKEAHEDVATIHTSGQHLLSIINEILDLAKIEAGQMSLDPRGVEVKKIAEEVLNTAQVLLQDKPVTLELVEASPVDRVSADPLRLRQIITNLVSNAIKFTERGAIVVTYGHVDASTAYIEVRDSGIGMSDSDLQVIFQQFRQVDGSSTRRAGGTGLGLTITKALVELHGGTISVRSALNQGTTFHFTLPLHTVEALPQS